MGDLWTENEDPASKIVDARLLTDRQTHRETQTHTQTHTHTQRDTHTDMTDFMIVAHPRWATIKMWFLAFSVVS